MGKRNRLLAGLFGTLFTVFLGLAFGWHWINLQMNRPLDIPESEIEIEVAAGESLSHLIADLESEGLLKNGWVMRFWAEYQGSTLVQKGEYRLQQGLTPLELLRYLNQGQVVQHRISLIEGNTFAQFLHTLQSNPELVIETRGLSADQVLQNLNLDLDHPEGWFYPDTYQFSGGTSDLQILQRAHQRMREVLDELWTIHGGLDVIQTPYEALILASIVEKETAVAEERPIIAGVFVRRLQRGMRLQTDPTVIYGIENFDGNLTRADLNTPTPYNTYVIDGLPPTPIAAPGRAALEAVLKPAPGDAIFFVAQGDGRHYFSATLAEHNAAVRKYQQLQRVENYKSVPDQVE